MTTDPTPREAATAHAAACRDAVRDGQPRRSYVGPSLASADLSGAALGGVDLTRAYLRRADLRGANLARADLRDANLTGAVLRDADLTDANLRDANLIDADLTGADLTDANLRYAYLTGADLTGADLTDANLRYAYLTGANLPDGRTLAEWQADPLAGLCSDPAAVARATAAWSAHTWQDCPMHAAHGWSSLDDAPEDRRGLVATFVALFDGVHLPRPGSAE